MPLIEKEILNLSPLKKKLFICAIAPVILKTTPLIHLLQGVLRQRLSTNIEDTMRSVPWINPKSELKSMALCPSPVMKQVRFQIKS